MPTNSRNSLPIIETKGLDAPHAMREQLALSPHESVVYPALKEHQASHYDTPGRKQEDEVRHQTSTITSYDSPRL